MLDLLDQVMRDSCIVTNHTILGDDASLETFYKKRTELTLPAGLLSTSGVRSTIPSHETHSVSQTALAYARTNYATSPFASLPRGPSSMEPVPLRGRPMVKMLQLHHLRAEKDRMKGSKPITTLAHPIILL
ncbi:uncharacterized protein RHO25_011160 [Cercospora beticola]|uniref:Uncharacterized protein n=1 Tax=Cercospora beticola TaxID=122368 RepID=A0ABZ0P3R2_CERBT|nr:hypothetical protein RHO25_011160 [Cercospora beticola]